MDLKINNLPVPTWNWLKVNDYTVSVPSEIEAGKYEINTVGGIELGLVSDFSKANLQDVEIGAGVEFKTYSDNANIDLCSVKVKEKTVVTEPLRIDFDFDNENDSLTKFAFNVEDEAEFTVVFNYKGKPRFGANDIRFSVGENGRLTVIEIFNFEKESNFIDSISGKLAKVGGLKLMQVNSGEGNVSLSCAADLIGDKSTLDIDTGYLVRNSDRLDINYVARHRGKKTDSKILASGVLRDNATKTFRGTIDFIKGAKEATGDERENVLLMNEGVHNNTVPLILCAEEDVEGGHGATIGKLSEEILYYFKSRGIPEEEVNELMAKSKLDAIIARIPDSQTRDQLLQN